MQQLNNKGAHHESKPTKNSLYFVCLYDYTRVVILLVGFLAEVSNKASAPFEGLDIPNKRVDPGCWLTSGFEQIDVSLFQDPVRYGQSNGAPLYVPYLNRMH